MMESHRLAAYLASRIFHDLVSPLTTLINGCSLMFDDLGMGMRAEGEKLVKEGVAAFEGKVKFMRFALGSQGLSDGPADLHEVRNLFELFFKAEKARYEWEVATPVNCQQMRLLMNMVVIMLEPSKRGGLVKVIARREGDRMVLEAAVEGAQSQIKTDVIEALAGREPERGWAGGAVQPLYARLIAEAMGYSLAIEGDETRRKLVASGPAA